jgi:hypothetical protein
MSLTHSRDSLKSAVGEDPVRGAPAEEPASGPRCVAHRLHNLLWVLVCCFLCLVVAVLLLFRQAVQHQLVETDLDAAAAAFDAARRAQAHEHVPEAWGKAANAIAAAMAELHRQHGRFVLLRGYPRVHELLVTAIEAAQQAKVAAQTESDKQEARTQEFKGKDEAHAAIDAARASVVRASDLLVKAQACPRASRAPEVRKDLETVRLNIDSYRQQLADTERKHAPGDFKAAQRQANTLIGEAGHVCAGLERLLVRLRCR